MLILCRPYHKVGQAHGLSFILRPAVRAALAAQRRTMNSAKDLGVFPPPNGDHGWAAQGVLLLNAGPHVREASPVRRERGWEPSRRRDQALTVGQPVVFGLGGGTRKRPHWSGQPAGRPRGAGGRHRAR